MTMVQPRNKLVRKWIREHGAASFDFKNHDVIFGDGGLFSIDSKKKMVKRAKGFKKIKDSNMTEVVFTKKKYPITVYQASMWFEDIDDTIDYFKDLKKLLNTLGYKTSPKYKNHSKVAKE